MNDNNNNNKEQQERAAVSTKVMFYSYCNSILHTRSHVKVPYECVGLANLSSQLCNLCRRKVKNKLAFPSSYDLKSTS